MKIAAYIRVSTKEQADSGLGLEAQLRNIRQYLSIYHTDVSYILYKDEGFSGTDLKRNGIKNLLTDAKLKKFEKVIIYKLDRLSRNLMNYVLIEKLFSENNISLISISEQFDTSQPIGKAVFQILATFAEMESNLIGIRTTDAAISNFEKGNYPFRVPYGYQRDKNQQVKLHPKYSEVVKYIFQRFIIIQNFHEISKELSMLYHVKCDEYKIQRILKNPAYTGNYVYREKEYKKILPGLITEKKHKEVIDLLNKIHKVKNELCYIFGNKIYCSKCNVEAIKTSGNKPNKKYYYYRCNCEKKMFNVSKIQKQVYFDLIQHTQMLNDDKKMNQFKKQIHYLNTRLNQMNQDFIYKHITVEQFAILNKEIETEKQKVISKMNVLIKEDGKVKGVLFLHEAVKEYVERIEVHFPTQKVEKVVYYKNKKSAK